MLRAKYVMMLLCATTLFSCVKDAQFSEGIGDEATTASPDKENVVKGWVRIKLQEDAQPMRVGVFTRGEVQSGDPEFDRIATALGATEVRKVFGNGGKFEARHRKYGLHLWYDVRIDESLPVSRAQADLSDLSFIEISQPIYKITLLDNEKGTSIPAQYVYTPTPVNRSAEAPFDDPDLKLQWHYNNDGSRNMWEAGADINLFEAWKQTAGDRSVIVAVIDGGVQYDHPDLAANMWVNEAEKNGTPGVDDDNNGFIDDIYGWNTNTNTGELEINSHGTHVAGTVSAVNNNGIGGCGVAGGTGVGDGVRVMSCQVFADVNVEIVNTGQAFVYAADMGAVIAQNSWVYDGSVKEIPADVSAAMDYFIDNAGMDENGNQVGPMKGGVLIFCAGNENTSFIKLPAADPRTIAVTSISPDYTKALYSNYGEGSDLIAPGGSSASESAYPEYCRVYSTDKDNGYCYKSGTSMACPHVSGIAALIVSHNKGNGFTNEDMKQILLRSNRSITDHLSSKWRDKMGRGLVDAALIFLEDSGQKPVAVANPQAKPFERQVTFSWEVPVDGNNMPAATFQVAYTGKGVGKFAGKVEDVSGELTFVNTRKAGERVSFVWRGNYNTAYSFDVKAVDGFGNKSAGVVLSLTTEDYVNKRPKAEVPFQPIKIANAGEANKVTLRLSDHFTDVNQEDGDILSYSITNASENIVRATIESEATLVLVPLAKGVCNLPITVTDLDGEVAYATLSVEVENGPNPGSVVKGVVVYPNPADAVLNVKLSHDKNFTTNAVVYDSAARKQIQTTVAIDANGVGSIDVSKLSTGTYTITLKAQGVSLKSSFIKR